MRKGAEICYLNVEFNHTGEKLASISSSPDYLLSIWDWMTEKVILKCKAFSQDIYRVEFSPFAPGNLITSGTGHIRFWKMATTFTGLKLQGEIGKFGQLELSDVYGFAEFADGKVVSGTEYGTLILWEGNLVKAHIKMKNGPLHNGPINVVINSKGHIITAGADGYIRWWLGEPINNAEPDETIDFIVEPVKEQLIQHNGFTASIIYMIPKDDKWLVENSNGTILLVTEEVKESTVLYNFHGGMIKSMAMNHKCNTVASSANDGMVRVWDIIKKVELANRSFNVVATSIDWMPTNHTNQGKIYFTTMTRSVLKWSHSLRLIIKLPH
jgi:WD40 repeat protein